LIDSHKTVKNFLLKTYLKKWKELIQVAMDNNEEVLDLTLSLYLFLGEISGSNTVINAKTGEEIELIPADEIEEEVGKVFGAKKISLFETY
jgi:hypothetical protein